MRNAPVLLALLIFLTPPFLMAMDRPYQLPPKISELENGVYAAALTPMHPELSCDTAELADHCNDLLARGCKGVVLFGTTGEGPSFSVKERLNALERVIQAGVDPQKIILGNGSANIPDTVELAKGALKNNCRAILIAPPSFFKTVTEEGVIAFYREIIQATADPNLRVLLYHIPQFSGVPITTKIIHALREEFTDIVIGIKESEGNLNLAMEAIRIFPGFKVFVGNEKHIIETVQAGGSGTICGIANLYPELICSLYQQGKTANAANPQALLSFFEAMKGYPFVPAFKAMMQKKRGSAWHSVRPPLVPLSADQSNDFLGKVDIS
ncbi:MAG: dihydrodipicolinate synthase family protein [Verrucomicrobia bacterium]|nr:dihydrodipicolinate synthase family protein [Verrucomicrobiota bacterium]